MKAITLRPIWAWAVAHGPKRVENRTWAPTYRGPLAIHAGVDRRDDAAARAALAAAGVDAPEDFAVGAIVATADLVDVVPYPGPNDPDPHGLRQDPLAFGPFCWIFEHAKPLRRPVPAGGKQSFWNWAVRKHNTARN